MKYKNRLAILALSTTCLVPLGAMAADDDFSVDSLSTEAKQPEQLYLNFIEGGLGYVGEESAHFGRFSGLDDKEFFFIGNASVIDRGEGVGFRFDATDLGTDARSLRLEAGRPGRFGAFLSYEGIPALKYGDTVTPYSGTSTLTLPAGWAIQPDAASLAPQITAALREVDIGQERQRYSGGASWQISPAWQLEGKFQREIKDGNKTFGLVFGSQGGTRWTAVVPEPVNYVTDTADVALSYNTRAFQMQLSYELSLFDNTEPHLTVENPYDLTATAMGNEGGSARVQLAPDNSAHLVRFSAGYNVSDWTRLTTNLAYGVHLQDDPFLPYSNNPAFTTAVRALPRTSLDGEVHTTLADVGMVTRPTSDLDLKASLRFFDRDNRTPQNLYNYAPVDDDTQGADNSAYARYNHPYSYTQYLGKLEGVYRLTAGTRVNLGYEYEHFERTHSERDENYTHTGKVGLSTRLTEGFLGSVGYLRSHRTGSTYDGMAPLLEGHHADYLAINVNSATFRPHPGLRKLYEADRIRDQATASLTILPSESLSFGLSGTYRNDDYDETEKGLTGVPSWSATADISYTPSDAFTLHAFYTYDHSNIEQAGHHSATTVNNDDAWFTYDIEDVGHTAGVGATWEVVPDVFAVGAEYTYSNATSKMDLATGPSTPAEGGLPEVETTSHTLSLTGDYSIAPDIVLRLGYLYGKVEASDYAYDSLTTLTSITRTFTMGETSPNYDVHVISTAVRFKF